MGDEGDAALVVDDARASAPRFGEAFGGARACAASAPAAFFDWLLAPASSREFERSCYERRPLLVRRADRGYYDGLFAPADIDAALRAGSVRYTRDLDLTRYTADGGRETLNPRGGDGDAEPPAAAAADVWGAHARGCSVRLSWPQRIAEPVWRACHLLDEHWGGVSGANAYLTPSGCRGFAPHWDDVDAFVLQLGGSKAWSVHPPRGRGEAHPRASSPNLREAALAPAALRVTLRAGELLYLPRGWAHHAATPTRDAAGGGGGGSAACGGACADVRAAEGSSLHLTLSVGQRVAWADFADALFARAVERAAAARPRWRRNLPRGWERCLGLAHAPPPGPAEAEAAGAGAGAAAEPADAAEGEAAGEADGGARAKARRRAALLARVRALIADVAAAAADAADDAADALEAAQLAGRLPPPPPPGGRVGAWRAPAAEAWAEASAQGEAEARRVSLGSQLRLRCRGCARLLVAPGAPAADAALDGGGPDGAGAEPAAVLLHSLANTRVHRALDAPAQLEFALRAAPALEALLTRYPAALGVAQLPLGADEDEAEAEAAEAEAEEGPEAAARRAADDEVRLDVARALVEAGVALHRRAPPGSAAAAAAAPPPRRPSQPAAQAQQQPLQPARKKRKKAAAARRAGQ